jgi:flagellar hook-associated protein 2
MDIDQLVADLMKAERMPLDKMKQKKQVMEWQREDYRSMNTLLLDFRSQLTQMKLTSNYRVRQATSTDESKVSVSATSAASMTSNTINKVEKLASAETRVNNGKIYKDSSSFDTGKSLYTQKNSFVSTAAVWKDGAVMSKSITTSEALSELNTGITNIKPDEMTNWNVKVNGVGFKAIVEAELSGRPLRENEVLIGSDGSLTFGKEISKGSQVKIDYVAVDKAESLTLTNTTATWQLSQGSINEVTSLKFTNGTATPVKFEIVDSDSQGIKKVMNGQIHVGDLDMNTGKITFTEAMPLPPKQTEGAEPVSMKLEATYTHKYTNFSMISHTSKGPQYEMFLVSGSESLNNVISKVNSSSVGATMFYDSFSGQMTLSRSETGDFNKNGAEISTYGGLINEVLQFKDSAIKTPGLNAKFDINGLSTERPSNTFEVNGVTFTLKAEFKEDSPVSTSVSNDSGKVVENIKDFVKKYNEMIDTIQKKLNEEAYRSYTPLTDEQREQLSDKQQERWEEKAKSGLIRRDPILTSALSTMRMNFYQPVTNDGVSSALNQLSSIGITTTSNYLEGGKLEINEAQLRKAVEEDPESVENLFRGTGTTESQQGIIQRLYDTVNTSMEKVKLKAGNSFSTNQQFTMGKQLDSLNKSIDRFEDRLTQVENRYWSQFTAMEKAIQRSNEQMAYLMQQFGG